MKRKYALGAVLGAYAVVGSALAQPLDAEGFIPSVVVGVQFGGAREPLATDAVVANVGVRSFSRSESTSLEPTNRSLTFVTLAAGEDGFGALSILGHNVLFEEGRLNAAETAESGSSTWLWWVGGLAVVGGVAAVVSKNHDDDGEEPDATPCPQVADTCIPAGG